MYEVFSTFPNFLQKIAFKSTVFGRLSKKLPLFAFDSKKTYRFLSSFVLIENLVLCQD